MIPQTPLSSFAQAVLAAMAGTSFFLNPVAAATAHRRPGPADPAPSIWVTVDPSGSAHTITPTVTAVDGVPTTISAPPEALTRTEGFYTLSPSGVSATPSIASGVPPPAATAKVGGKNGEGAFLTCGVSQGGDVPFCQPRGGSLLHPGKTYYVTWRSTYIQPNNTAVRFQADFLDGSRDGFTSDAIPVGVGYYTWAIPPDFLAKRGHDAVGAAMYLVYTYAEDGSQKRVGGAKVVVTHQRSHSHDHDASDHGNGIDSGRVSAAVIVAPVVVGVVLLGLAAFCFLSYRRNGTIPFLGAIRGRSGGGGKGYGVRQSRSQRAGGAEVDVPGGVGPASGIGNNKNEAETGIQLTDRESWSPTGRGAGQGQGQGQGPGRNVFREELQRQRDRE